MFREGCWHLPVSPANIFAMSSWVLEQPTRRLLTVKCLPQWQRGLWNPKVQESFLCALTSFMLGQHLLPLDFYLNSHFKDEASAGTCWFCLGWTQPPIPEPFPCLRIKPVSPSFPTCVFSRTGPAHLLTSLFQAACSLMSPQSLSLSETQTWAFSS